MPDSYDGPPAWWTARQDRASARRPLCDEHGTPTEDDEGDDNTEDEEQTMTTETNPLTIDRFTVHVDNAGTGQLVIADRDLTPINAATATAVLGDRAPVIVWEQSDRYGWLVFPVTDEGDRLASLLCAQLNDADAENDAAGLIDSAASLAERIEATPDDGLTAEQRRGLAAYRRAVVAGLWYRGEPKVNYDVGERVTIGSVPPTHYERGVMAALNVPAWAQGATATVILPAGYRTEMAVLLDDRDDPVALPSFMLYVRRVTG